MSETPRLSTLDDPRSPHRSSDSATETFAWLFMRFSGVVLAVLVLTHVVLALLWGDGVYRVDFTFVAQHWASPRWRAADLTLLWLAEIHGGYGLRRIIDDYSRRRVTRLCLTGLLALAVALTLAVGTYTIVTFDPYIS